MALTLHPPRGTHARVMKHGQRGILPALDGAACVHCQHQLAHLPTCNLATPLQLGARSRPPHTELWRQARFGSSD
jgi:hypothetical protein